MMLSVKIEKKLHDFELHTSFTARNGITGIIGPSGCGKSLTLQCIAGLVTPDKGKIMIEEKVFYDSNSKTNIKTRHRNIGYVFQHYALFPHLNVEQNIAFGLKGMDKQDIKDKVSQMLEKVLLKGYEKRYPYELSGGQQQRVALARTLITEPDLLLLDEPFSALDYHVKDLLEQELLHIIKENFTGVVLLVTHNMEEAYRLCDDLLLLHEGQVVQFGQKNAVFRRPENVAAAKIIGCKNILKIDSLKEWDNGIECLVQNTRIWLNPQSLKGRLVTHIGIHDEDIRFVNEENEPNTFPFEVIHTVTGLKQSSVTIRVGSILLHTAVSNNDISRILAKKLNVYLPPEKLFFLVG
ncbi:ABC transporter ATP-binding protein [Bacillus sp. 31A1R]|uniref:ABC transporter ATP-binding protein n=1 Tax=Robertmurraya mangrovi TaxID=3098077 RepID=A0ABU5ITI0_9BACI|nr:ABC transporter ATP-binding protein [Bacillus sp. 31A1R]MDZ5470454.1 ABC transporter ATP-binding protein [Bacillus sp. 31A1R]